MADFLHDHWHEESGNAKEFFDDIVQELRDLVRPENLAQSKVEIKQFIEHLAKRLSQPQKEVVIELMEKIAMADFDIAHSEEEFIDSMIEVFSKRWS